MISPQRKEELNKSTGVGGEAGDLETDAGSVRGSVAGVETMGTSGVCMELGNLERTTLETCLKEGLKGSSLDEGKSNETISSEESEEVALFGNVALSKEVVLSEETRGARGMNNPKGEPKMRKSVEPCAQMKPRRARKNCPEGALQVKNQILSDFV